VLKKIIYLHTTKYKVQYNRRLDNTTNKETNSNVACPLMIITKDSTNTWAVDSHRIPQEFYNVKVGDCKALRRSSL